MAKKLDRYEFIWKAIQKHGYKDDLREVNYENSKKKIKIICPIHGEFWIRPNDYLNGSRCSECANEIKGKYKLISKEEYFKRVNEIHKYKYKYDTDTYENTESIITYYCPYHGKKTIHARQHLNGRGCIDCYNEFKRGKFQTPSFEEFEKIANEIHNFKYKYIKETYIAMKKKMKAICPIHGEFDLVPSEHIKGHGCKKCGLEESIKKRKMTREQFIEKAEKIHVNEDGTTKNTYNDIVFIDRDTEVEVTCKKHGNFKIKPKEHLKGTGCPKCRAEKTRQIFGMTNDEFINRIKKLYGDLYNTSKVDYKTINDEVILICKEHGEFRKTPLQLLYKKSACPICSMSNLEKIVMGKLNEKKIEYVFQANKNKLKFLQSNISCASLSLDFYLPQYNIAIECQGSQHFEPNEYFGGEEAFEKQIERDERKKKLCEENNVKLIYINYFDSIDEINNKLQNIIKEYDNKNNM